MTTDPEQIRGDIHETQRELSANVDALTEKLSPPRMVERRVRRTRAAMTNVRNKIMGSAASGASSARDTVGSASSTARETIGSMSSSARDTVGATASSAADMVSSAPDMVRQRTEGNPLAAGLVAFGAGWLVSSLLPATSAERQIAMQVKESATEQARPVARQLGEAAQEMKEQLREPAQQAAESVKARASGAASAVSEQTQSAAGDVSGRTQQAARRVRNQGPSTM